MKIVLVRPNYNSHIITPPLGIGYLSACLKREGINTIIIDALRDNLNNQQVVRRILFEKPDAVGITCLTAFYNEVVDLSRLLKQHNIKCIIGGVHPTFLPYQTLVDSKADYVVCGEGEIALVELAKNRFVNKKIQGVYSLSNLKDSKTPTKKAKRIEALDELPFPDWEQINPNIYPRAPHGAIVKNFPIGVIMTTRGCPYECAFCASPKFYDRTIRFRSPEKVIKEIKYLIRYFGIKEIHFEDDNLTLKREHVVQICKLILKNNIRISWACPNGIRADKVDGELIELMKRSGCYYFAYGVESANPQILSNIRKQESIKDVEKAIEIADKKGISCQGFFIFGLPGETTKTIEESINFAKNSRLSRAQFLILDILPGSELWDTLKGKFSPKWDKDSFREAEWIPPGLTKEQIQKAQSRAFWQFYLRKGRLLKLVRMLDMKQFKYIIKRLKDYHLINK